MPLVNISHIRDEDAHDNTNDAGRCGTKTRGIRTEALGRDLANKAPTSSTVCGDPDIYEKLANFLGYRAEGENGKRYVLHKQAKRIKM